MSAMQNVIKGLLMLVHCVVYTVAQAVYLKSQVALSKCLTLCIQCSE